MTEREAAQLKREFVALRGEVEEVREALRRKDEELRRKDEELRQRERKIAQLEASVQALLRRLYGAKSEKLDPAQLELLLSDLEAGKGEASSGADAPEEESAGKDAPKKRRKSKRKNREPRLPEGTPVVIEAVVIPEEVLANPEEWVETTEEHSDLIDYRPEQFLVRRTILKKFKHRSDRQRPPVIAPAPPLPIPGARCTPALAAQILYGKYVLHLPLYRQQSNYWIRHQVHLPRSTLNRWVLRTAERLKPIALAIENEVLSASYKQIDETPHRYLERGRGKSAEGRMWVFNDPTGSVCYRWYTRRNHECLLDFLVDAESGKLLGSATLKLQCDRHSAYTAFANKIEDVELAGCLAHVRRYFREAMDLGERRYTPIILRHIANLYVIEERLRERKVSPVLREAVRASESLPILRRLYKIITLARKRSLPGSAVGRAADYALKAQEQIEACFLDGRLEVDNNLAENAIRPLKLGQKNWLFIGNSEAGWVAALFYTLVENCKRHGLDPYRYLVDVLNDMPQGEQAAEDVAHLTPARLAAATRTAKRPTAA